MFMYHAAAAKHIDTGIIHSCICSLPPALTKLVFFFLHLLKSLFNTETPYNDQRHDGVLFKGQIISNPVSVRPLTLAFTTPHDVCACWTAALQKHSGQHLCASGGGLGGQLFAHYCKEPCYESLLAIQPHAHTHSPVISWPGFNRHRWLCVHNYHSVWEKERATTQVYNHFELLTWSLAYNDNFPIT